MTAASGRAPAHPGTRWRRAMAALLAAVTDSAQAQRLPAEDGSAPAAGGWRAVTRLSWS